MKKLLKITDCYVVEKRIVSKLSKNQYQILIAEIEDMHEDCIRVSRVYLFTYLSFILSEK